jgi:ribonuclease HII
MVAKMTRDRLASLTDEELVAYEREHHGNPYMTLARAKEMRRVALRFWHLRHR